LAHHATRGHSVELALADALVHFELAAGDAAHVPLDAHLAVRQHFELSGHAGELVRPRAAVRGDGAQAQADARLRARRGRDRESCQDPGRSHLRSYGAESAKRSVSPWTMRIVRAAPRVPDGLRSSTLCPPARRRMSTVGVLKPL